MTPEARRALKRIRFYCARCPRFVLRPDGTRYRPECMLMEDLHAAASAQDGACPEGRWRRPKKDKAIVARAAAFLAAVSGPAVDDAAYAARREACESNVCGHLIVRDEKRFCGACGCPKWKLAELSTKLRFANLECPCDPPLWGRADVKGDDSGTE